MTEKLPPIVRAFEVRCSVEHAFDTWTRRTNLWWPLREHSLSRDNAVSVTIEPWCGGQIFETTRIGHEVVWGTVNVWEPPNRFGYLWHLGQRDTSKATQATITFTALDSSRTRVEIEHRGWERADPKAVSTRRRNEGGWDGLEAAFARFVNEEAPPDP
jgi:activator of Hsp90 ATPase-like protein